MAAITDLASASSLGASDLFVVNQSGTDRKMLANKLPMLDQVQSFTAAQTFTDEINVRQHTTTEKWSIDVANGTALTMANAAIFQFSAAAAFAGLVVVLNTTNGGVGLFLMGGAVVVEVADGSNTYSVTKDTGSSTNIYWDSGSSQYLMQNNTGGSRTYNIFTIRTRASS